MKKNLLIELLETGEKVLEKKKIITIIGTNLNGPLEITINTKNLDVKVGEDGGKLTIEYEMSVYGQPPFNTKLSLSIKVQK